jgi:Immunity protein 44
MRIFISGEIDGQISNEVREIRNEIDRKLNCLENNDYGSEFVDIGIIPIIIDPKRGLFEAGFFKERKLIKRKAKEADIRLKTDFNKFQAGDNKIRRLLLIDNVIRSIRVIGEKSKSDFNAEKLISDIIKALEIDAKALDDL